MEEIEPIKTSVAQNIAESPKTRETHFSKKGRERDSLSVETLSLEDIDFSKLISRVNKFVHSVSTKVSFRYDDRTGEQVILVLDQETGKVIRQVPPEEMLELIAKLRQIAGLIYHDKA